MGKPIEGIRFTGLSAVSETELTGLVRSYIAQNYSDALSWEIQGKLYALDYFDLIIPRAVPGGENNESVILVFEVEEKPLVEDILFMGINKVRGGEIKDAVLVKEGDILNSQTLELDEQAVQDLYLEKGYVDAKISAEFTLDEVKNTVVVTFQIEEGVQTKISEIRFEGNDQQVSDNTLRGIMSTKPQSLFNKGLYVETKLQEDLRAIEQYYGDKGFIDARIVDTIKDVVQDEEKKQSKLIITIVLEEGNVWSYGGMTFQGNNIYSLKELEDQVLQQPGRVFSRTKFQLDYQRITDLYFENGYIFNTFAYEELRVEERREVSYNVTIVERDRAHIENIIIRGNDKTKSYVIRKEFPLEEGDVFSKTKILEGTLNLYNLRYFDTIEPQPYPGSEEGLMDLVLDVQEGKTADIIIGFSFSGGTEFPLALQVKWSDRNFLGRGNVLGAEVSASPQNQRVALRYTEPRILGQRWSGGIDLSYSHSINSRINQDFDGNRIPDPYQTWEEYEGAGRIIPNDKQMQYDSHYISTGLSTGYTWVMPFQLGRFNVGTGIRFIWEYVIYDPFVFRPASEAIRDNLNTWKYQDNIWLRLSWDTRDLQYDPNKGFILSNTLTWAGILSVSSRDYIKNVSRYDQYFTILDIPIGDEGKSFKSILQLHTAFNALLPKPWTGIPVDPQRDGFYIDGMFIGRGWYPVTDGQYLWDNTIQLKFPLISNWLAFDLFFDAVGIWESTKDLHEINANDFRFSIGGGFRFANPQFPIGLYLVKKFRVERDGTVNWNPEPETTEIKAWGMDIVIAFSLDIY